MQRINVQVEIPESMDNFINLLPLSIRKQYISSITTAILKQNEQQIIENVQNIVQSIMTITISSKDEQIMQEELDNALAELAVKISPDKKTIKGKAKKDALKKSNIDGLEEIQPTILKDDVSPKVEKFQSVEAKEEIKNNVIGSEHLDIGLNNKEDKEKDKKAITIDLQSMFDK